MLYVTTRNERDTVPAQYTLNHDRGPDGGLFCPFRAPAFTEADLEKLARMPFSQRIAEVLNLLFQTKLTRWDIDFCIGRNPIQLVALPHRVIVAECWHNPQWNFEKTVSALSERLQSEGGLPGNWTQIAVRIACLFAIFGELRCRGIEDSDISLVSGSFAFPISAWYARSWGLPIGNIVCGCNENKNLWDLIVHGQMRTDSVAVTTNVPEADVILPENLERLLFAWGGAEEVSRYLHCCRQGRSYAVSDTLLKQLQEGLYVSVVSSQRLERTIPGVLKTHGYLLSLPAALAYAGLQDYRAKNGATRCALVIAEKAPAREPKPLAKILGLTEQELQELL